MRRRPWTAEALWTLAVAAGSLLIAGWVLHWWDASLSHPWSDNFDALQNQAFFKTILTTGWYSHDPALGAPFGQDSLDFPIISNLSPDLWFVKVLGIAVSSPVTAINLYYVATFPAAAIAAFLALRALGVSRGPAATAALLFAVTPYHFQKGEQQVLNAAYYTVPLLAYLALKVLEGDGLFGARRRTAGTVALCALVGLGNIYYGVFGLLLALAATVVVGCSGNRAALKAGVVTVVLIGVALGVSQLPTALYRHDHGPNTVAANRPAADSETFGLKLDQLVLPIPGHRIGRLADLGERLETESTVPSERSGTLGIIGVVGLTWLLLVALMNIAGPARAGPLERRASVLTVIALLIATIGGLSAVIAFVVTPQIRSWDRMSVVIAFLALLAIALLLQRGRGRVLVGALVAVLVIGVLDGTTPRFAPDYAALTAQANANVAFAHGVEQRLGRGAELLMLPYAEYPEDPHYWAGGDYEHLRPYLNSSLRLSYGAVKGRPDDWQATMNSAPLNSLLEGAAASGFKGAWIDTAAYTADNGAAIKAAAEKELGPPLLDSGRYAVYDLRPLAQGLPQDRLAAMRADTVTPMRALYGAGFSYPEGAGADTWRWAGDRGTLTIVNPGRTPRPVRVSALLRTDAPDPGSTVVTTPDGKRQTLELTSDGAVLDARFDAPPGRSAVTFDTDSPAVPDPARSLVLQVKDLVIVGGALCLTEKPACATGPRPQLR